MSRLLLRIGVGLLVGAVCSLLALAFCWGVSTFMFAVGGMWVARGW